MKSMTVKFLMSLAVTVFATNVARCDEQRWTLTDVDDNVHVDDWEQSGNGWSITKRTLRGGKQEGVDLITIDNGVLEIDLVPSRGMSIYEIRHGELRIGWDAPIESLVHPALVDLESRGGIGWLEGFNEWMVRCGLEFAGHPGYDEQASRDLTLHGKIGNIPAGKVEVIVVSDPKTEVRVRGTVFESFFNGPKLKLTAELVIQPGKSEFRIEDEITNQGSAEQEFQIIYHANYGTPLLGKGARVHTAARTVAPMDEHAAKSIDSFAVYDAPKSGFQEQVYLIEPYADQNGLTQATLANAVRDLAVSMSWSTRQLPYLTVWKNTAALQDGYVTGIEPATGYPYTRSIERASGRVPTLPAGASRSFKLGIQIHNGANEVAQAIADVEKIRKGRDPKIRRTPLETVTEH